MLDRNDETQPSKAAFDALIFADSKVNGRYTRCVAAQKMWRYVNMQPLARIPVTVDPLRVRVRAKTMIECQASQLPNVRAELSAGSTTRVSIVYPISSSPPPSHPHNHRHHVWNPRQEVQHPHLYVASPPGAPLTAQKHYAEAAIHESNC